MPPFKKHRLHRDFRFQEDGLHLDGNGVVDGDLTVTGALVAQGSFPVAPHAVTHKTGGTDPIALDTLAAPSDNTNLNSSTLAHGLLPKLSGAPSSFLRGDGVFAVPTFLDRRTDTVDLPYPATRSHKVTVSAIGATALSKILLFLDGVPETQENASDMIDIVGMRTIAAANSFELQVNSLTPIAGALSVVFLVT